MTELTCDDDNDQDRTLGNDKLMALSSMDSLRIAVRATAISSWEREAWFTDFQNGRFDARVALMLSLCPNLRTLSVTIGSHYRPLRYIQLLAHHASYLGPASSLISSPSNSEQTQLTPQNILAALQEVRIHCTDSLDYDETLPITNLLSMRTLYTYGLSTSRWNCEPPPASSGLWHLQLDGCDVNLDELFWMLRSCRALRTLEYMWDLACWCEEDYRDDEDDEDDTYTSDVNLGPVVIEALSSGKSSLTSLKMDGYSVIRSDVRSGSLLDFKNLRQIWAPSVLVLNATEERQKRHLIDVLPIALESLHLIIDGLPGEETLMAELLKLVESETRPMLRQIVLDHRGRYRFHLQNAIGVSRLEAACVTAGISLQLNMNGYSNERAPSSVQQAER